MLFSRWKSCRSKTWVKISSVRTCWISISRTSASASVGLIVSRAWSRNAAAAVAEAGVVAIGVVDLLAQRVEHPRQVVAELRHRLAELGDLRPLPGEEAREQAVERLHVGHVAAVDLAAVLDQSTAVRLSSKTMLSVG